MIYFICTSDHVIAHTRDADEAAYFQSLGYEVEAIAI